MDDEMTNWDPKLAKAKDEVERLNNEENALTADSTLRRFFGFGHEVV